MELPPILRLPDEMVHQILSSASHTTPRPRSGRVWEHKLPSVVLNICLTCSHFNRISRSFIFESVYIRKGLPARYTRASVLPAVYARFRDEPELRPKCKKLQLDINRMSRKHYRMVRDLLRWLSNVRYLSISGFFAPEKEQDGSSNGHSEEGNDDNDLVSRHDLWALMGLVNRYMGNLELLRCNDHWGHGCRGSDLISNIDIPSLNKLQIWGLSRSSIPPTPTKVCSQFLVISPSLNPLMLTILIKQRTAAFTSLTLDLHDETQEMVSRIISWSRELTEFRLYKCWNRDIYRIDLSMVQSWLQVHKTTLRYIMIDELSFQGPPEGQLGFDATDFTSLEHLHLSRWLWSKPLDLNLAKAEARLLLAPKLRVFVWDFTAEGDGFREFWTNFGAKEEEWLKEFAQVAISQRDRHCLEEIRIRFEPEDMGSGRESEVYPWDRMDRVREEVVQQSEGLVALTYNEPVFSREDWKEHLEWKRKSDMKRMTHNT